MKRSAVSGDLAILHVSLPAGSSWRWPKPNGWSCMLYTRRGAVTCGGEPLAVHHTATLRREAGEVDLRAQEEAEVLLLAGAPVVVERFQA